MFRNLPIISIKRVLSDNFNNVFCRYYKPVSHKLTPEEASKVLSFINRSDNDNLLREVNLTKARITKIEKWKKAHGSFETVEQFVDVNGFGAKSLEKTCDAILKTYSDSTTAVQPAIEPFAETKTLNSSISTGMDTTVKVTVNTSENNNKSFQSTVTRAIKRRLCTPILSRAKSEAITSFISIHVAQCGLGWTRFVINKDKVARLKIESAEITDWNYYRLDTYKMHLIDMAQLYTRVNKMIPQSDIYIMEEQPINGHGSHFIQQAQSVALLTGLLANRVNNRAKDAESDLYFIANNISGKLYGIFVGSETISTKYIVRKIMNPQEMINGYIVDSVAESMASTDYKFARDLCQTYKDSQLIDRELLGRSMLIGTTFLRLCILGCTNSLALAYDRSNSLRANKKLME